MDGEDKPKIKWRTRLRKVLLEWARCKELPESAIIELELQDGRANVVVKTVDEHNPPSVECHGQV